MVLNSMNYIVKQRDWDLHDEGLEWKKGFGVDSQSQSTLIGLEFWNQKEARMRNGEAGTEAEGLADWDLQSGLILISLETPTVLGRHSRLPSGNSQVGIRLLQSFLLIL